MKNAPCKNCTIRALRCHSTCAEYAEFRKACELESAKRAEDMKRNAPSESILKWTKKRYAAEKRGRKTNAR